jgi:hypothetical protein
MIVSDKAENAFHYLMITESCEDALRRFQKDLKQAQALSIWIDAICIDQSNTQERNQQVSMMGDVYGSATTVWVWLGPGTKDSDKAFKYVQRREGYMDTFVGRLAQIAAEKINPWVKNLWPKSLAEIFNSGMSFQTSTQIEISSCR